MRKTFIGILAALVAAGMALSLAGCGEETAATDTASKAETTAASTTAASTAAATTAEPTTAAPTTVPPTTVAPTTVPPTTVAPTKAPQQTQTAAPQNNQSNQNTNNNSNNNNNNNNTNKSGGSGSNSQSQQPAKQVGSFAASDVVFVYNGASVALNSDMNSALSVLGNANQVDSQLSCHGVGEDKTYSYNGFTVNTYPLNGKDYVLEVVVSSSNIATPKGVHVGSTEADVIAAYGTGYQQIGYYYSYQTNDGKSIQFFMEDGVVEEIDYYYDV